MERIGLLRWLWLQESMSERTGHYFVRLTTANWSGAIAGLCRSRMFPVVTKSLKEGVRDFSIITVSDDWKDFEVYQLPASIACKRFRNGASRKEYFQLTIAPKVILEEGNRVLLSWNDRVTLLAYNCRNKWKVAIDQADDITLIVLGDMVYTVIFDRCQPNDCITIVAVNTHSGQLNYILHENIESFEVDVRGGVVLVKSCNGIQRRVTLMEDGWKIDAK